MEKLTSILIGLLLTASAAFAGIGSPPYNPAAVAITGGAISGTTGQIATAQTAANAAQTDATNALAGGHYGQTWQIVTGSRAADTYYTNSTGKIIAVSIDNTIGINQSGICYIYLLNAAANVSVINLYSPTGLRSTLFTLVPPGEQYKYVAGTGCTFSQWAELR